jgi:hypothetical protein
MGRMAQEIQFLDSRRLSGKAIKHNLFLQDVFIQDEHLNGVDVYRQF